MGNPAITIHGRALAGRGPDDIYDSAVTVFLAAVSVLVPVWVYFLFSWDQTVDGFVVVPIILGANLLVLLAVTRENPFLRRCMIAGLLLKFACAAAYLFVSAQLWGFSVDSYGYLNIGSQWANQSNTLGYFPILQPWWGTNFVTMLTGVLVYAFGWSFSIVSALFASAGYWGQYFAFRAFTTGVPKGNHKMAACLLFLLPSISFWTSMIGKDALLCLAIALIAYGFVQTTSRLNFFGLAISFAGLCLSLLVRPHVAALAAVAATVVLAFSGNRKGALGTTTRLVVLPLALAATVFLARNASQNWQVNDVQQGMARLADTGRDTAYGGSAFEQSSSWPVRLAMAPFLMFRPFPWEIRNPQMGIAAAESFWVAVLFWRRRRRVLDALRSTRNIPILGFSLLFTFEFAFTMAPGIGNFGLLVRQRVMVLPYALLFICVLSTRAQYLPLRKAVGR